MDKSLDIPRLNNILKEGIPGKKDAENIGDTYTDSNTKKVYIHTGNGQWELIPDEYIVRV